MFTPINETPVQTTHLITPVEPSHTVTGTSPVSILGLAYVYSLVAVTLIIICVIIVEVLKTRRNKK